MNLISLALANIRKNKSATLSLTIFILIASLLLSVGLMVMTQISTFFDYKNEALHDPHVTFVTSSQENTPTARDYLKNYPGVTETEVEDVLEMEIATFQYGEGELTSNVIILNADASREIGPLHLIDQLDAPFNNDVFIPYSFKTNGGYELGDSFTLIYQNQEYTYRVAGFFETTMMGTNNIGMMKFMLPETSYNKLSNDLGEPAQATLFSSIMKDPTQSSLLNEGFIQEAQHIQADVSIVGLDIDLVKSVSTLTVNFIATILVAFAAVIVLISLIVIRYRVSNSIEDGMENIGVLKAIGYTSRQILYSIILQFVFIVLIASTIGVALSYGFMPILGGIISRLTGLVWVQRIDPFINLVSVLIIMGSVILVALLSAIRVRNILPVAALRGGIQTHSFKKNYFSLEKAKGSLHTLLALKSTMMNAKQNMMISLIVAALTFASIFSAVLYYNLTSDKTAFINLFGSEPANLIVTVNPEVDSEQLVSKIRQMDHVDKVNVLDFIETRIEGQTVYTNITKQYEQLENTIVYEGREPKHENEVSISWVIANRIGKGIGDTVEITYKNETKSYLITGISQAISNLGKISGLTMDGIRQLDADYQGSSLYIYLNGGSNRDFVKDVQNRYGESIAETLDIDENVESQTSMYTDALFAVMMMVLTITVLVVSLILYLVIKTMIIKRKQEFGVMKAIGYSTLQLMNQIAISFLPVTAIGVTVGGLIGYFFTNPVLSFLLSTAGVKRLEFLIPAQTLFIPCAAILILSFLVSMFVSRQIKSVSAYELITE